MSDSMDKHFMTLDHQDWTPVVFSKSSVQKHAVNKEQQRNMSKQTKEQANTNKG